MIADRAAGAARHASRVTRHASRVMRSADVPRPADQRNTNCGVAPSRRVGPRREASTLTDYRSIVVSRLLQPQTDRLLLRGGIEISPDTTSEVMG
jgi:hypothetical protein